MYGHARTHATIVASSALVGLLLLSGCSAKRSDQAFCSTMETHKERYLKAMQLADTDVSKGTFGGAVGGIAQAASAVADLQTMWNDLAKVAPEQVQGDVERVRDLNQKSLDVMGDNGGKPLTALTKAGALAVQMAGPLTRVDEYTRTHCGPSGVGSQSPTKTVHVTSASPARAASSVESAPPVRANPPITAVPPVNSVSPSVAPGTAEPTSRSASGNTTESTQWVSLAQLKRAAALDPPRPDGETTPGASQSVLVFERALSMLGYLDERWVDGSYGTETLAAMKRFQIDVGHHDLDGIPGPIELQLIAERSGLFRATD